MLKKLENMKLKERLNAGYRLVIVLMLISGVLSIVGMATLYMNLHSYINKAQRADTAAKMCQIQSNIAARTIREMSINEDGTTHISSL